MKFFFLMVLVLLVSSCGKSPTNILSKVNVETIYDEDDLYLSFIANLKLGAMSFGTISLPVFHPRSGREIGEVHLLNGGEVRINLNLTSLTDLAPSPGVLPNGHVIPLIGENEIISIDVGRTGKIYVLLQDHVKAVGVAIPLTAFDSIGRSLPGLNLFPIIPLGQIIGTAGLFTSMNSGENGIAVVADITQALTSPKGVIQGLQVGQESQKKMSLNDQSQSISRGEKRKLDLHLLRLNQKRARLEVIP